MAQRAPLTDDELQAAVKRHIEGAMGFLGSELSEDRRRLLDRYYTKPLGNEIEGRSQVQSSDVQDVVESVMPEIMQIFAAGEDVVEFSPEGPEDEKGAEQATDYINLIWKRDNDGFAILHDWFKDGFLQINGFIKIVWEVTTESKEEKYSGLTEQEVSILANEDGVEVTESEEREELVTDPMSDMSLLLTVYDITIRREVEKKRLRVYNVPPEEMLIARRSRDLDSSPFLAHMTETTEGELIAEGYDPEIVREIPTDDGHDYNEERISRFERDDEWPEDAEQIDRSMRPITKYECYPLMDADGDGIAERRKVVALGPAYRVVENEPVAEHPFETVTPIRMPHKVFGRALAELAEDIQLINTTIWRQSLDNVYNINNARLAVSNKVSMEDVLTNRVGAPIRVDDVSVAGHIEPVGVQPILNQTLPMLEFNNSVMEKRTGVTRYSQGLDADSLNKTATGINQILGRSQQRILLMVQVMALGVKAAMRKTLRTVIRHQDKPRMIRLRNEWVEIDPRHWNADMDVTVNVGLGHGTHEQKVMALQMMLNVMERIAQHQGGLVGPLVGWNHVSNAFGKMIEQMGMPSPDPFVNEVSEEQAAQYAQQAQQQPNPEVVKVQMDAQLKQQQMMLEDKRKREEMYLEHLRALQELGLDNAQERASQAVQQARTAAEVGLQRDRAAADVAVKRENNAMQVQVARERNLLDASVKKSAQETQGGEI